MFYNIKPSKGILDIIQNTQGQNMKMRHRLILYTKKLHKSECNALRKNTQQQNKSSR